MTRRFPKFMNRPESGLIAILIALMVGSFYLLASIEHHERRLTPERNLWTLSFQEPKSTALDFMVANYTKQTDFTWSVQSENGQPVNSGTAKIIPGTEQIIRIGSTPRSGKVLITVSDGNKSKQIYKIFPTQ